jgi:rubrerythrin
MWRSQGYSWGQISKKLLEEYGVEISKQGVYEYYKNNLEKNAQARLKELYDKQKGEEGATEKELVSHIDDLNFAIKRAREALEQDWIITKPHQMQAAISGLCTAIKTKTDVLIGQEKEQENPIIQLLKMRAKDGNRNSPI